jgi:hypothetical protein
MSLTVEKKHRVIGIRHTLRKMKDADLISDDVMYPDDAVKQLKKTTKRARTASRHRSAREDANVDSLIKTIEKAYNLPSGSVKLQYPNGRKVRSDTDIGQLRSHWQRKDG